MYRNLLTLCWHQLPEERPTFATILDRILSGDQAVGPGGISGESGGGPGGGNVVHGLDLENAGYLEPASTYLG